jgi:hypothetical protein
MFLSGLIPGLTPWVLAARLLKKMELEENDELRPEYDLRSLRVRKLGPERRSFGGTIHFEPDVAEVLPETDKVIEKVNDESSNSLDL